MLHENTNILRQIEHQGFSYMKYHGKLHPVRLTCQKQEAAAAAEPFSVSVHTTDKKKKGKLRMKLPSKSEISWTKTNDATTCS